MLSMTLWSLTLWIAPFFQRIIRGQILVDTPAVNGLGAAILFSLALLLVLKSAVMGVRRFLAKSETLPTA
jgi:hypothetical protein